MQPFELDGDMVVCNGELYGFRRVRDRLREKGYVRFDSCETDDRRKPISVTEKARALQETLNGSITELERLTFRGFTEQDCEAFSRLQEKVLRNLSAVRGGTELEVHPQ